MKHTRPRIGDANHTRMLDVSVKLATDQPLDRHDKEWLSVLLAKIQNGDDVRPLFFKTVNGRPGDGERNFWIATDVAWHRKEMTPKAAYITVAELWHIQPDNVENIWKKCKADVESVGVPHQDVIRWHRERLTPSWSGDKNST